ncbi:hypothetical protein N7481_006931 [Penicillium waksmanii]|uniref:uncharacterized protein n=1 Tax=Penicillium waksmanii TaxID=69791 RepID=UPI0025496ADE|nr:uncharacterized protein N7481_006931 [Penicillium waksmanii]KAJ5979633.1 hypothetical protein N7481_006931 [Penicillium waksmanii]
MSQEHESPGEIEDTDSFELTQPPEESGPLQRAATDNPRNVQWKPSSRTVDETLADGLSNEDLWMLIRRFNKVYFASWAADLLIPMTMSLFIALIMFPPIRPFLFPAPPPQPPTNDSTSNLSANEQQESQDSLTGVPENHKGETAEQEAKVLLDSFATMAVEGAAGKFGYPLDEETAENSTAVIAAPPIDITPETPEVAAEKSAEDQTKKPMKKKVSQGMDQAMRVVSDITDIYERFANILSPTPPFYLISPRLRISGILSIVCLVAPFASSYWIIKLVGFALGFAFFGAPAFTYTTDLLNRKFPEWQEQLDINMTLLKGVPTNAQLTLTLLRIGEINSSPLPPPPTTEDSEPAWPIKRKKSKAVTIPQSGDLASISNDSTTNLSSDSLAAPKPKKRTFFKILKFFRRTIATAIRGHIAFDRAMAIAGSAHTKNLLGMLQNHRFSGTPYGPLKFDAKFERKRGAAVIDSTKEPPILYFTTYQSAGLEDLSIDARKKGSVLFQIPVTEIQELRKTEGLGWKGKLIVELTAGSKEAADGMVVVGNEIGQSFHLTGMRSRNQLFNRLVAIDAQFWESR